MQLQSEWTHALSSSYLSLYDSLRVSVRCPPAEFV